MDDEYGREFGLQVTRNAAALSASSHRIDRMQHIRFWVRSLSRVWGGHILALADQAVVSAASFLTTVIISRYSDAGQLGTYAIGISVLASAYTIQGQLISLPYSIQRHRPLGTPSEHSGGSLALAGLLAALITLLLTIIALSFGASGASSELTAITWALAAVMPFTLLRDFFRRFAFTQLQMVHALVLDAAVAAIQLSMLGWLGWTGLMSAVTASIALGVSCGIAALGCILISRAQFAIRLKQVRATMWQSWNLGKWLVVNQTMVQVQRYSTYWLLVMMAGATVTGVYTACMSIVAFTNPLFYGLNNLLTQKSVLAWKEGGGAGLQRQALRDLLLLAAALGPFCLLALWFGGDAMRFLYHGSDYLGHGYVIAVLAFATFASALGSPAGNALASMERPRTVLLINVLGTILTVLLVWRSMAAWGLVGAAYGWLLSNAIVSLGLWLGFMWSVPQIHEDASIRQVLGKLTGDRDSKRWIITHLGEGDHSNVYSVRADDGQPIWQTHRTLVIKVYKPEARLTLNMVNEQFASFLRLHASLDGRIVKGWTVSTPKPLYICKAPLALVMTAISGKKDLRSHLATDNDLTTEVLDALGRVVVAALQQDWSRGQVHGDLALQNILYNILTKQLSFIDPGTRECCIVCTDAASPLNPAVLELGHILRDLGTDKRDLTGSAIVRTRRQIFTESALRTFLATIDSPEEKHRVLENIRECAETHLSKVIESSWLLHTLCNRPLTRFVMRRIDAVLSKLQVEMAAPGGTLEGGDDIPLQPAVSSQIKNLDRVCLHRHAYTDCCREPERLT
jgi:O-antigen/teichoic acid export membrane protein